MAEEGLAVGAEADGRDAVEHSAVVGVAARGAQFEGAQNAVEIDDAGDLAELRDLPLDGRAGVGETADTTPEVPIETTTSPSRTSSARAAAALSPAPGPSTAPDGVRPTCSAGPATRAVKGLLTTQVGGKEKESADKPGSVEDNHSSAIRVAAYLQRPTREHVRAARAAHARGRVCLLPYLVLLRAGFAVPRSVATRAVRSYRTISPLPAPCGA